MKIITGVAIGLMALFIAILMSGCHLGSSTKGSSEMSYNKLIGELKSSGYKIDEIELTENETKYTFFSVYPQFVDINGQRISVYEFPDKNTAVSQAETISKDGFTIGNTKIDWIDKPHFYKQGRLIVGYAGSDNEILNNLKKVLGEPITE